MKLFSGALLFTSVVIVRSQLQDKVCTSQSDCDQLQCCATYETKRAGKRFIFGPLKSVCKPRRYQGQACHVYLHHDFSNPDIYLDYCPCDEGLECRGTTIDGQGSSAIHHNPKCLPISGSSSTKTTATATTISTMTATESATATTMSSTTSTEPVTFIIG